MIDKILKAWYWIKKNHLFLIAVGSIFSAYSLNQFLWKGSFYHLTALSFVCLWRMIYLASSGHWSLAYFVVWMMSINNLLDEIFFDPKKIDYNEYFSLLMIVVITMKYKHKWKR